MICNYDNSTDNFLYEMKPFIISLEDSEKPEHFSTEPILFSIYEEVDGQEEPRVILSNESYWFDHNGQVSIDISHLLASDFRFELPSLDKDTPQQAVRKYKVQFIWRNPKTVSFNVYAVKGKALTQMSDIDVLRIPSDYILPLSRFRMPPKEGETPSLCTGVNFIHSKGQLFCEALSDSPDQILLSVNRLLSIPDLDGSRNFRVEVQGSNIHSPEYIVCNGHFEQYLFLNRNGGFDNVAMDGILHEEPEISHEVGKYQNSLAHVGSSCKQIYRQHSGYLSETCLDALRELLCIGQVYHLSAGRWRPIVIVESDMQRSSADDIHSMSFQYRYTDDARIPTLSFKEINGATVRPLNMGGFPIVNLKDPTNPQDAATKKYVDDALLTLTKNTGKTFPITANPQVVMYDEDYRPSVSVTDKDGNEVVVEIVFNDAEKHCVVQWKNRLDSLLIGGEIYVI